MSKRSVRTVDVVISDPPYTQEPYTISSIFTAHRDLRPLAKLALKDSKLSIEEADILVTLLGASTLGWGDVPVSNDKFVALKDVRMALVHDASLFARRLKKLTKKETPLVTVRGIKGGGNARLHGNSQEAQLTDAGIAIARNIWDTFRKLESNLLSGLDPKDLEAHERINNAISQRLRDLKDPAKQLLRN
jgi:hypothetical protein